MLTNSVIVAIAAFFTAQQAVLALNVDLNAYIDANKEMTAAGSGASSPLEGIQRRQGGSIPVGCTASTSGPPAGGLPSVYPAVINSRSCSAPIVVSANGAFNGHRSRYDRGAGFRYPDCRAGEPGTNDSLFILHNGATLMQVTVGEQVRDGVVCQGNCTLWDVWFENTCEDSVSFKPASKSTPVCNNCRYAWSTGGVRGFLDKAVQHNNGGTAAFWGIHVFFDVYDKGKFYRSCGASTSCPSVTRHSTYKEITVYGANGNGEALAGINADKGDTARFTWILAPQNWQNIGFKFCKLWPEGTTLPPQNYCFYDPSVFQYEPEEFGPTVTKLLPSIMYGNFWNYV